MASLKLKEFCCKMPKIELHAHINGSISEATMEKILKKKNTDGQTLSFMKGQTATLDECFKKFKLIHLLADNTDAAYMITYDVIHEFAKDNVKYLELRSTPREVTATGMTKSSYVEAVIKAIEDCSKEDLDIVVKFLPSVDRRNGVDVAKETVELAERYSRLSGGIVVGVDLSGDPNVGDARDYIPIFEKAKQNGLKLALHLAEVPAIEETLEMLKLPPDRIGHGTCLHSDAGGSEELADYVYKHKIPLGRPYSVIKDVVAQLCDVLVEIHMDFPKVLLLPIQGLPLKLCLTSNVIGQTVPDFDNHQFLYWYQKSHPCVICTDDKGVFNTSLSEEYELAAKTFNLSEDQVWSLSYNSVGYIFADEGVKETLRQKFLQFRPI